jgi:glycosyltransferase involved in cell wall biosynthesis
MKLCIIVANSLRKDPRVIKQIRCAMDEGIDVYFIGFMDSNYDKKFLESVGCHISMVDFGKKYSGHLKSYLKLFYREFMHYYLPIKMIVKIKPDVIHANDFNTLIQAYIASKISKCRVLYDSHEICAENIGIADSKIRKHTIITVEHILLKRIGTMVSVSNAAAAYFSRKYKIPLPTVITNCPYRGIAASPAKKDFNCFEVLYQGQMYQGRGYEEFVKSAKFINSNIILVLRGYGSIEDELRKIISIEHLEEKVRFDAPVEIKEIVNKAAESHVGVVLTQPININFKLTVSNKIFEYLHAGLPVIMSDIPEHRYLNDKFNFGIIVNKFSPTGIAECINNLSTNHPQYSLLKNNAIKAAETMCWENESKKLIAIYKSLSKRK